jgi:hypothetical protein
MFGKFSKKLSLAVLAGLSGLVATNAAQAGSYALGNSGWTASWDSSNDGRLALNVDGETCDSVFIEKHVTFYDSDINESGQFIDPVVITFQQTSAHAAQYLVINDESVTNRTGQDWTGFRMTLLPSDGSVSFDPGLSDISPPGNGFSIDPFTTHDFAQNNSIFTVGGGVVPTAPIGSNTWYPGAATGNLVIDTNAGAFCNEAVFTLKEQPLTCAIPLPAAAWSGLTGLAGLALAGSRKSLRGLLA